MLYLQHLKFFFQFLLLLPASKNALDLVDMEFHILQVFGKKDSALVQKPHMVADVLQFPQIVGCDHRSKFPVHDL